jgi:hypothetical protein
MKIKKDDLVKYTHKVDHRCMIILALEDSKDDDRFRGRLIFQSNNASYPFEDTIWTFCTPVVKNWIIEIIEIKE